MLVLSRHRDESIIIGDDIVITIVDIRGDKVRLGIAAPIEISVHRQEVYDANSARESSGESTGAQQRSPESIVLTSRRSAGSLDVPVARGA